MKLFKIFEVVIAILSTVLPFLKKSDDGEKVDKKDQTSSED